MPLAARDRIGPYEIIGPLGAGGMGEVYRARDSRLGRDVAVKILPAAWAADAERLRRFEREAQLLASLNHPNIATILGVEESSHGLAIVLELVEGDTLAEVIARGPVAPAEAIAIAGQVAAALNAAHDRGVIHRDLKPANVKRTPAGIVKVLDFGLAKAVDVNAQAGVDPATSPTITARGTVPGLILGTAAYMAPEQARGQPVDQRADIWAFGALLFEMLSGGRAFDGHDATDVIASVIAREPDWTKLPATTPPALVRVIRRSLQKDPARRLHHIADARLDLEDATDQIKQPASISTGSRTRRPFGIRAATAAAAIVAVAVMLAWTLRPDGPSAPDWIGERLGGSTVAMGPALSPDGQTLAFLAMVDGLTQVAVMKPQSGNWTILTKERGRGLTQQLTWSRDGSRILFDRFLDVPNGIFSVPVFGGEERLVVENAMTPRTLSDGSLVFTRINAQRIAQLHRFWPESDRTEPLPAFAATLSRLPTPSFDVFPSGRELVYVGRPATSDSADADHLWVLDLQSGRSRRIGPDTALSFTSFSFPLAVTDDGQFVLFTTPKGNTHPIVQVAGDGSAGVQTILPLTQRPVSIDAGPHGSLYVDQLDQPAEVFRFDSSSGTLERTPMPATLTLEGGAALPLADGRLLLGTRILGRERIVTMAPGREAVPFIDTDEETSAPMAALGRDAVVLFAGARPNRQLVIASIADGRIRSRFRNVDGNQLIGSVAGAPDGKTVFYIVGGELWTVSDTDAAPRRMQAADGVAVSPDGQWLAIMLSEAGGIRLVRHHLNGGPQENIPLGSLRLSPWPLAPNAVAADGRIALRVTALDSWFWPAAVLNPATGRAELLPEAAMADMLMPGWDQNGRVVTIATFTRSTLWHFRRDAK